jgi:hypothetical protein
MERSLAGGTDALGARGDRGEESSEEGMWRSLARA